LAGKLGDGYRHGTLMSLIFMMVADGGGEFVMSELMGEYGMLRC